MESAFWVRAHSECSNDFDWFKTVIRLHLSGVLLPQTIQSNELRTHYTEWINQSVLGLFRISNMQVIEDTLLSILSAISHENHQEFLERIFIAQLPLKELGLIKAQDVEFVRRYGLESTIMNIGSEIRLAANELFDVANDVFATREDISVKDISGNEVIVGLDEKFQNIVLSHSNHEGENFGVLIPELTFLSQNQENRMETLDNTLNFLGPTATNFESIREEVEVGTIDKLQLIKIFDEKSGGVVKLQSDLKNKLSCNLPVKLAEIIPQSISYFERFAGPNPNSHGLDKYIQEILVPYRKMLLNRDLQAGLDICCLGAFRDDLMPGEWVSDFDDDVVWKSLTAMETGYNPFSLLGALDVALYRNKDQRFQEFAVNVIAKLLDVETEGEKGETFKLLVGFSRFAIHFMNFIEDVPNRPNYWKKMCTLMQAGILSRILVGNSASNSVETMEQWIRENVTPLNYYAELTKAREEPMLLIEVWTRETLQHLILGGLRNVLTRHENEGRKVTLPEEFRETISRGIHQDKSHDFQVFDALGSKKPPSEPIPQDFSENLDKESLNASSLSQLQLLLFTSQFYSLGESERENARTTTKNLAVKFDRDEPTPDDLVCLEYASLLAAINRDEGLADIVSEVAIKLVVQDPVNMRFAHMLHIILQSAGAIENHSSWMKWLEDRFTAMATRLPFNRDNCLHYFLYHLDQIGTMLPIESWFHIRARCIASAGIR